MIKLSIFIFTFCLFSLTGCTTKELKTFGKDVAHNVHCDQQYEHMHKGAILKDDCLNNRPE